MQAKLKGAIWASFAGGAFVALVATQMATLAGTLMASLLLQGNKRLLATIFWLKPSV